MKQFIPLFLVLCLVITSCKESKDATDLTLAENTIIERAEIKPSENIKPIPPTLDYTFDWNHVAGIKLGDDINKLKKDKQFRFKEETEVISDEGYEYEVKKLVAYEDNNALFELHYSETPNVEEIYILSDKFKNKENLGVGNTFQEFAKKYPFAKANYSYVGGNHIWLENGNESLQFNLEVPDSFYNSIKINSDAMEIPLEKIPADTEISSIRIFGNIFEYDIIGNWESSDKMINAKLSKIEDHYHIELSTGKDIYNKFSQALYPNLNYLYSLPSEKTIEVYTYELPNNIVLMLDDNKEFEPLRIKLFKKP